MASSAAKIRANNKYNKKTYQPMTIRFRNKKKDTLAEYAEKNNVSLNELTIKALEEYTGLNLR